jgi:hypothetical protein
MPDFIGFTMAEVDNALSGNPTTAVGLDRHYQIVPPRGSGPVNPGDLVVSQDPAPGTCSQSNPNSTLYLTSP